MSSWHPWTCSPIVDDCLPGSDALGFLALSSASALEGFLRLREITVVNNALLPVASWCCDPVALWCYDPVALWPWGPGTC